MFTLYGNPGSTCTRKVLMLLAERGAEARFVNIDLGRGEQKSADHLARHPFGVVPVLMDGDFKVYESRAIIRYLDRVLPGTPLTPEDNHEYGMMEQFINVEQAYFAAPAMKIVYQRLLNPMRGLPTDEAKVEEGRNELSRCLNVLEERLSESAYLAGPKFSLADITYLPYCEYLFAAGAGDLITGKVHVSDWWTRCSQRDTWQKAIGRKS